MTVRNHWATKLLLPLLAFAAACGEPTAPGANTPASVFRKAAEGDPVKLVTCPSKEFILSFAAMGPSGGEVTAGPVTMAVPPGALHATTAFVISVPRSRYMEVQILAVGTDHFVFERPVTITLDYSRCHADLDEQPLTAWFIDSESLEPLAPMITDDDRLAQRAIFVTDHLSRYALAQ